MEISVSSTNNLIYIILILIATLYLYHLPNTAALHPWILNAKCCASEASNRINDKYVNVCWATCVSFGNNHCLTAINNEVSAEICMEIFSATNTLYCSFSSLNRGNFASIGALTRMWSRFHLLVFLTNWSINNSTKFQKVHTPIKKKKHFIGLTLPLLSGGWYPISSHSLELLILANTEGGGTKTPSRA